MRKFRAWLYFEYFYRKDAIKPYLKPTIIISFGIAWMITNGWSYILLAIGTPTMRKIALSYIAFLWLPISPEKIVTIPLAFFIQKLLFKSKK